MIAKTLQNPKLKAALDTCVVVCPSGQPTRALSTLDAQGGAPLGADGATLYPAVYMPLGKALETAWRDDAHVQLLGWGRRAPFKRLKRGKAYRIGAGVAWPSRELEPRVSWLAVEVDRHDLPDGVRLLDYIREGEGRLWAGGLSDVLPDELLYGAVRYFTRRGVRWLVPLSREVSGGELEQLQAVYLDDLKRRGVPVDDRATGWTRLWRLPDVERDGVRTIVSLRWPTAWMPLDVDELLSRVEAPELRLSPPRSQPRAVASTPRPGVVVYDGQGRPIHDPPAYVEQVSRNCAQRILDAAPGESHATILGEGWQLGSWCAVFKMRLDDYAPLLEHAVSARVSASDQREAHQALWSALDGGYSNPSFDHAPTRRTHTANSHRHTPPRHHVEAAPVRRVEAPQPPRPPSTPAGLVTDAHSRVRAFDLAAWMQRLTSCRLSASEEHVLIRLAAQLSEDGVVSKTNAQLWVGSRLHHDTFRRALSRLSQRGELLVRVQLATGRRGRAPYIHVALGEGERPGDVLSALWGGEPGDWYWSRWGCWIIRGGARSFAWPCGAPDAPSPVEVAVVGEVENLRKPQTEAAPSHVEVDAPIANLDVEVAAVCGSSADPQPVACRPPAAPSPVEADALINPLDVEEGADNVECLPTLDELPTPSLERMPLNVQLAALDDEAWSPVGEVASEQVGGAERRAWINPTSTVEAPPAAPVTAVDVEALRPSDLSPRLWRALVAYAHDTARRPVLASVGALGEALWPRLPLLDALDRMRDHRLHAERVAFAVDGARRAGGGLDVEAFARGLAVARGEGWWRRGRGRLTA